MAKRADRELSAVETWSENELYEGVVFVSHA